VAAALQAVWDMLASLGSSTMGLPEVSPRSQRVRVRVRVRVSSASASTSRT